MTAISADLYMLYWRHRVGIATSDERVTEHFRRQALGSRSTLQYWESDAVTSHSLAVVSADLADNPFWWRGTPPPPYMIHRFKTCEVAQLQQQGDAFATPCDAQPMRFVKIMSIRPVRKAEPSHWSQRNDR